LCARDQPRTTHQEVEGVEGIPVDALGHAPENVGFWRPALDRVLDAAGLLAPADLRSLDAIHLASAEQLGTDLRGS
jgi:hypothetical protein